MQNYSKALLDTRNAKRDALVAAIAAEYTDICGLVPTIEVSSPSAIVDLVTIRLHITVQDADGKQLRQQHALVRSQKDGSTRIGDNWPVGGAIREAAWQYIDARREYIRHMDTLREWYEEFVPYNAASPCATEDAPADAYADNETDNAPIGKPAKKA